MVLVAAAADTAMGGGKDPYQSASTVHRPHTLLEHLFSVGGQFPLVKHCEESKGLGEEGRVSKAAISSLPRRIDQHSRRWSRSTAAKDPCPCIQSPRSRSGTCPLCKWVPSPLCIQRTSYRSRFD